MAPAATDSFSPKLADFFASRAASKARSPFSNPAGEIGGITRRPRCRVDVPLLLELGKGKSRCQISAFIEHLLSAAIQRHRQSHLGSPASAAILVVQLLVSALYHSGRFVSG